MLQVTTVVVCVVMTKAKQCGRMLHTELHLSTRTLQLLHVKCDANVEKYHYQVG